MLLKRFRIPTFAIGLLALASLTLSGTAVQEAQAGNSLNKALGIGLAIGAGALIINELDKQNKASKKPKKKVKKKTWKKNSTVTKSGPSSSEVRAIQAALNDWGFDAGSVDGSMGRRTRAAIRSFQYSQGDKETGWLTGQQTRTLLNGPSFTRNNDDDGRDDLNDGDDTVDNQDGSTGTSRLGLVSLMNDLPAELIKLCSVPFNVITCFDLVTLSADQEQISLEAIIGDDFVEMNFTRLALQNDVYQGKIGNKDCELKIYEKPEFSKDDDDYVYAFLGFQECEGIYVSALIPKSGAARKNAIENDSHEQAMEFMTSEMKRSNSSLHASLN